MQDADILYKRIVAMSSPFFVDDNIGEIGRFRKEAKLFVERNKRH